MPTFVRLDIVGATIGPGKADGTQWDGIGRVPQDLFLELQETTRRPVPEMKPAFALLAAHAMQAAVEKPEPIGYAELDRGLGAGFGERVTLSNGGSAWKDTFTPTWRPPASWTGVTVHNRVFVRVALFDQDVANDDPIASVNLNANDIAEAVSAAGHVIGIPVAQQSQGQLLLVHLAAFRER